MLLLLPAASAHSIVMGFLGLTLVIVLSLCPNGALLALASSGGKGPAMPLNLAVVCSCLLCSAPCHCVSELGFLFRFPF